MRALARPITAAVLALALVAVFAGAKVIHYDDPAGTWLGFCECRIHVPGLGDVVVQYWEIDSTPGLSRGDRIYSRHVEPCIDGGKSKSKL